MRFFFFAHSIIHTVYCYCEFINDKYSLNSCFRGFNFTRNWYTSNNNAFTVCVLRKNLTLITDNPHNK